MERIFLSQVAIAEDVQKMLNDLSGEWLSFQQTLIDADVMLKKNKVGNVIYTEYNLIVDLNICCIISAHRH